MQLSIKSCGIAAAALLIVACASHPDPIIDTKGVDMAQYQKDLDREFQAGTDVR